MHASLPVRANQKDLYYLLQLTDQLEEVVRGLFGALLLLLAVARMLAAWKLTVRLFRLTFGFQAPGGCRH